MSFGRANGATAGYRSKKQNAASTRPRNVNSRSGIRGIIDKSRLTEEDLENFRLSIIKAHKKKHYKFLLVFSLVILLLGFLIFYFIL